MARHNAWPSPDFHAGRPGRPWCPWWPRLTVLLHASSYVRRTDGCALSERLYAAKVIVRVWLERRPEDDLDELRAYV